MIEYTAVHRGVYENVKNVHHMPSKLMLCKETVTLKSDYGNKNNQCMVYPLVFSISK